MVDSAGLSNVLSACKWHHQHVVMRSRQRAADVHTHSLRQVALLDGGASSRVTEIAAKSLANLGSAANNRTGIRLAGGIPPLVALLMEQPSQQVREHLNRRLAPGSILSLASALLFLISRPSRPGAAVPTKLGRP